jgi:transcriptional regulator with AAA-type ATPase domain
VRDLRQLVTRMTSRHVGSGPLPAGDVPGEERNFLRVDCNSWCDEQFERAIDRALHMGARLKEIGKTAEDVAVRLAVYSARGNLQDAAQRLGVSDRALQLRKAQRGQSDGPQ